MKLSDDKPHNPKIILDNYGRAIAHINPGKNFTNYHTKIVYNIDEVQELLNKYDVELRKRKHVEHFWDRTGKELYFYTPSDYEFEDEAEDWFWSLGKEGMENMQYHFCSVNGRDPFNFTVDDIISLWKEHKIDEYKEKQLRKWMNDQK